MYEELDLMEPEVRAFLVSLDSLSSYSRSTRQAYANDLYRLVDYLKTKLRRAPTLEDFNEHQVAEYLETERRLGMRSSTLLRRRAALRSFEKYLIQQGFPRPVSVLKVVGDQLQFSRLRSLSSAQVNDLQAALGNSQRSLARRDHAILILLLETGLSVSKLVSLNLPDLDLRIGKLHILFVGQEDFWLPLGNAVKPLDIYLREGRPELNPGADEPALFISQVGTRMTRQTVWQVLRHWGELVQLPFTLSPRLVRHTAALRLARSGRSVSEIQVLLGHSNPLSTRALLDRLENSETENG